MTLDLAIIAAYFLLVNGIGIAVARSGSVEDYFLGGRNIPWYIACFSIVATETSTLTLTSIPGVAYSGSLGFLQVALGYIAGRIIVAWLFLPAYFEGRLETAYQFLHHRFGTGTQGAMAGVFLITRLLAEGIRLFAASIPLAMLLGEALAALGLGDAGGYRLAIVVMSAATVVYTYIGGIRAVAVVDTIQLVFYLAVALTGMVLVMRIMDAGPAAVIARVPEANLRLFTSGFNGTFWTSYNIFSGFIGGTLLAMGSHGTDHLIVQRLLACRDLRAARLALVTSGFVVFAQFTLFMFFGLFLHALYEGRSFTLPDTIVPHFIMTSVPAGLRGLILAGILAAAMSSLGSSINAMASSTVLDIFRISSRAMSEKRKLRLSRFMALFWTLALMAVALLLEDTKSPLVELGLGIASVTYGGLIGIFLQARLFAQFDDRAALAGVVASIAAVFVASRVFQVFWPWYVPLGFAVSFGTGILLDRLGRRIAARRRG